MIRMYRLTLMLTSLLSVLLFIAIPCAAASGFYCEYTPKSEKSAVFYIDVHSSDDMSAAVMELHFDDSFAEYREATAVEKTSSVRAACDGGIVKLAFADSGAVKGKLCRVAFKALQAGTCTFTLHISQAADAEFKLLGDCSDSSVEVKLGKDDVLASTSAQASSKTDKSSSASHSYLKGATEADEDIGYPSRDGILDLRPNRAITYILLGAGLVLLIAAPIFAGVIHGRKTAEKKKPSPTGKGDAVPNAEPTEETPIE